MPRTYEHKDRTGEKYNRLTALARTDMLMRDGYKWLYVCDCGTFKILRPRCVVSGATKSCGCYDQERMALRTTKHGKAHSKEYTAWEGMIQRCNNPMSLSYKNYGGRGITVCEQWLQFEAFFSDMGDAPNGMSLERIDVNGNYCKDNCKWADCCIQSFNQRQKKSNTSGRTGVRFYKSRGKWVATIGVDRKPIHLGYFVSFEEACAAREAAELKYYGFTKE
jgi:hypothetical protein